MPSPSRGRAVSPGAPSLANSRTPPPRTSGGEFVATIAAAMLNNAEARGFVAPVVEPIARALLRIGRHADMVTLIGAAHHGHDRAVLHPAGQVPPGDHHPAAVPRRRRHRRHDGAALAARRGPAVPGSTPPWTGSPMSRSSGRCCGGRWSTRDTDHDGPRLDLPGRRGGDQLRQGARRGGRGDRQRRHRRACRAVHRRGHRRRCSTCSDWTGR